MTDKNNIYVPKFQRQQCDNASKNNCSALACLMIMLFIVFPLVGIGYGLIKLKSQPKAAKAALGLSAAGLVVWAVAIAFTYPYWIALIKLIF